MKKDYKSIFLLSILILFVIYLITIISASLISGISLFDSRIIEGVTNIFLIALVVLAILSLAIFIFYKYLTIFTPYEILKRDNTIVCNIDDKRNRIFVDVSNINEYLDKYKALSIIDGYILKKKDKNKKVSANNLLYGDSKQTLADLYKKDVDEYNKIADFIKDISNLNIDELFWKTEQLVKSRQKKDASRDIIEELMDIKSKINNREIRNDIDNLIKSLRYNYDNVQFKIINQYLPILINICKKYSYLEDNKLDNDEFMNLHNNLHAIINSINQIINNKIDNKDEIKEINSLESILNSKNNG